MFGRNTLRRWEIFKNYKTAYYSLLLLGLSLLVSFFAELICNHKPIVLKFNENLYFPFLFVYPDKEFGGFFDTEANYKDEDIIKSLSQNGNWVIWAPIKFGPTEVDFKLEGSAPSKPDKNHILGTDDRARDVFARLLFGFRISLLFGLSLSCLGMILGIGAGALQGYLGGTFDLIFQRFTELWSSLPELFILIILSSIFTPSLWVILFLMAIMGWMGIAAYVRAEFLKARENEYVLSPIALGASRMRIMWLHIFPNTLAPVITFFPFRVSAAISGLASLDFLGLGVPSPTPSLGELLAQGKGNLQCWWIIVSTFVVMVFMILSLNFIGEGIQRAMDPKVVVNKNES